MTPPPTGTKPLLQMFRESVKNMPLLKYAWVLIASISILALIALFKLKTATVFYYAVGVIVISFLGFVFSYMTRTSDWWIRMLLRLIMACIALAICAFIIGLPLFIYTGKPKYYSLLLPDAKIEDSSNIQKGDTSVIKRRQDTIAADKKNADSNPSGVRVVQNNEKGDNNVQINFNKTPDTTKKNTSSKK